MEGVAAVLCLKLAKALHKLGHGLRVTGEVRRHCLAARTFRARNRRDPRLKLEDLCPPEFSLCAAVVAAHEAWKPDI
jgi:hypothetical protein